MAFSRKALKDMGLADDAIDKVMTLHGTSMSDYIPKTDLQTQIDTALNDYKEKNPQTKLTDDPDYQKVFAENAKLKAFGTDDFKPVKSPYRDIVWEKLDHSDKHKEYKEQLTELSQSMPDIFEKQEEQPAGKPAFGMQPKGTMPNGAQGANFADFMPFVPKKN